MYLWEYVDDISNKAMCVKWRPIHIIYRGSGDPREEREGVIDIDRVEERIKWVGARSMKRAIEIVCVQAKDIGQLTYRNIRGHKASLCVAGRHD